MTASPQTAPTIADTLDDLTAEWFTAALRAGGTLADDQTVTAVTAEPIGTGQVGLVARAALEYDDDAAAPRTLIAKIPSPDAGSRQLGCAMGLYEAEVRFYQEIAPRLGPAIPRMHWGDVDGTGSRFTLVLDDLSADADVGDMVSGCDVEHAALAISQLADLQAPIWDDPGLRERPWLKSARTDALFAAVAPSADVFAERFGARLDSQHLELARRVVPRAVEYRARAWAPPHVIVHSDYRLDNMLFGRASAAPPLSVVDWQGARLGPPLIDAAVFLASCVTVEDRRAHERDLLRAYHDRLIAGGVSGFSFDDCLEGYRRGSLWPFLLGIAVSVSVVQTERGEVMWARMVGGAAQLVLDTGAADLLD